MARIGGGKRVGLGELDPQPYWGFADLEHKAGTKLLNAFYVQAEVKTERGRESYWYRKAMRLQRFSFAAFLAALEQGKVLVDFDARSGHNHGTKFRMRQDCLPMLYENGRNRCADSGRPMAPGGVIRAGLPVLLGGTEKATFSSEPTPARSARRPHRSRPAKGRPPGVALRGAVKGALPACAPKVS